MAEKQVKSRQRVADHGEVFTAEREVRAMCDLVKSETERIESRFLEPACGNGNFLAEVLRRKLAVVKSRYGKNPSDYERYSVLAVTSIYGVDILADNAQECRERLFALWNEEYVHRLAVFDDELYSLFVEKFKGNDNYKRLYLVDSLKVYLTELLRKPGTADISKTMCNLKKLSAWIRDRNLNERDGVRKYTYKVSEKKLTELIEVMMTTYEINITEKGV